MRSGIDFFPLDTVLDLKFDLIEAEFGIAGFGVIVRLFQKIYGQEGYFLEVNDEVVLLFSREVRLGRSTVSEIISAAVRRGIFDKELYDRYNILTSEGIQKRYFEICKRRRKIEVRKEYLLGNYAQNLENVSIFSKNVCNSSKNADIFSQRKGKESKGKEIRESREKRYGEYLNVSLSDEELKRLKDECPLWKHYIERLSEYMDMTHKDYNGRHLAVILKWYNEDKKKNKLPDINNNSYDLDAHTNQAVTHKLNYKKRNAK